MSTYSFTTLVLETTATAKLLKLEEHFRKAPADGGVRLCWHPAISGFTAAVFLRSGSVLPTSRQNDDSFLLDFLDKPTLVREVGVRTWSIMLMRGGVEAEFVTAWTKQGEEQWSCASLDPETEELPLERLRDELNFDLAQVIDLDDASPMKATHFVDLPAGSSWKPLLDAWAKKRPKPAK